MELLIVTGMSGAGKTQAANVLEDMGYYCVDNVPPSMIISFAEFSRHRADELDRLAIITDIRGGRMFSEISEVLDSLRKKNIAYKILFLDASDEVLMRRYKENRRKHPLCGLEGFTLSDAVLKERKELLSIRNSADYIVDTSRISNAQLKSQLSDIFLEDKKDALQIQCKSFGFKYGADSESDLTLDVRCLPNPFYVEELKYKTGLDREASDYVMSFGESKELEKRLFSLLEFAVPLYAKEGKSQLVISVGCTGGKHRSVTFAENICGFLKSLGFSASTVHRDINKK